MRHRIGFACALAGSVGLAFLLVLACHPGFTASAAAGMSAPLDPATSIASAQTPQLLRLRLDWNGLALRTLGFRLAFETTGTNANAPRNAGTAQLYYGPLHRRPPPSFS